MVVLKGVLLIFIIFLCSLIGNLKAKSFEKRYLELKKFKSGLGIFRSKLEFTYEPIQEIFKDISKLIYDNKDNVFKRFLENENWDLSVELEENFSSEDKEVAKNLGKLLGKLDKSGQLNEINLVDEFLDRQIENSYEIKQKNEKLYRVLGKSVGIAIAIIFV